MLLSFPIYSSLVSISLKNCAFFFVWKWKRNIKHCNKKSQSYFVVHEICTSLNWIKHFFSEQKCRHSVGNFFTATLLKFIWSFINIRHHSRKFAKQKEIKQFQIMKSAYKTSYCKKKGRKISKWMIAVYINPSKTKEEKMKEM